MRGSTMAIPAMDQDTDQHTNAEGDSQGLIRMPANRPVGGLHPGNGFFLHGCAGGLRRLQRVYQTGPGFFGFLSTSPAVAFTKSPASRATIFRSLTNLSVLSSAFIV